MDNESNDNDYYIYHLVHDNFLPFSLVWVSQSVFAHQRMMEKLKKKCVDNVVW